jgi:hypothetical protein
MMRGMSYPRLLAVMIASGCATAGGSDQPPDGQVGGTDARVDAPSQIDDAQIDAPTGCTQQTVNLLMNGAFEQVASGWTETRYLATDAIIRNDGVAGQTPPYIAWLGGNLATTGQTAVDSIHQDIAIPASTTALSLTGFFQVDTDELFGVYDRARVAVTDTNNSALVTIRDLDNNTSTSGWTQLNHTFATTYAGQTIRLRLTSNSDDTARTHFFFDSLALNATVCQ